MECYKIGEIKMSWLQEKIAKVVNETTETAVAANFEKVKTHLQKNKNIYISAGIGIAMGASIVFVFKRGTTIVNVVNNFTFSHT
jgi:hypothetical protein